MARVSRRCIESIYYHIMVQGIDKEYILQNKITKNKYKDLLLKKSKQNGISI